MGEAIAIRVRRLPHGTELPLPSPASRESAGHDLRAAIEQPLELAPGERALIPTGLACEIPPGWELQVRPRSGLAIRHGVTLLNTPGTIDSDYRGELQVILINHGSETFTVHRGDRIAQLVAARVTAIDWQEVATLEASERGEAGFGSTGRD